MVFDNLGVGFHLDTTLLYLEVHSLLSLNV